MKECGLLVLGRGYVGSHLEGFLETPANEANFEEFKDEIRLAGVTYTKRNPIRQCDLPFQMEDPTTWKNIPQSQYTLWTFPPTDCSWVKKFVESSWEKLGKVVVIGTTGIYSLKNFLGLERVQCETKNHHCALNYNDSFD